MYKKKLNIIKAENEKDIYLVFEFMDSDLHAVIRAGILEDVHKQFITYQILKSLKYIHSGELMHRDLKPSNILLNAECHLKLADFGLARSVAFNQNDGSNPILTECVATRWYRAPEILLGSQNYTKSIDIWSVGCILGELINQKAIFPGNSTLNQIERILELVVKPQKTDIESIKTDLAFNIINSISVNCKKTFLNFFPSASNDALDLIKKCLHFNPYKRISVDDALRHPYLQEFSDPKEEIELGRSIIIYMNDNVKFSIQEYKDNIYNDICQRKKQQRKDWQNKFEQQKLQEIINIEKSTKHFDSKHSDLSKIQKFSPKKSQNFENNQQKQTIQYNFIKCQQQNLKKQQNTKIMTQLQYSIKQQIQMQNQQQNLKQQLCQIVQNQNKKKPNTEKQSTQNQQNNKKSRNILNQFPKQIQNKVEKEKKSIRFFSQYQDQSQRILTSQHKLKQSLQKKEVFLIQQEEKQQIFAQIVQQKLMINSNQPKLNKKNNFCQKKH